jgi:hypothetical protein
MYTRDNDGEYDNMRETMTETVKCQDLQPHRKVHGGRILICLFWI